MEGTNGRGIVIHKPDDVSSARINELVNRFKKGIEEDRASNQKISLNQNVSESVYDNAIYDYTNDSLSINSVDQWKLLSTVVSTGDRGRNKAIYSSIKVDGASVPSSAFNAPLTDYASITRDGNNTVTITASGKN
ncbi:hypothetical protein ABH897_004203 [Paenibacillus sp. RC73]|uniref:hypothetical protein n=1 Tax=Paenibacillus sp. RC73 TaxID=3156250 RepID=UPI003835F24A